MVRQGRDTNSFFDRWDMFAQPVSAFNLEGAEAVGTSIGCLSTVLMTGLVLAYAAVRGKICFEKTNPLITDIDGMGARAPTDILELSEYNFTVAFRVINIHTKEPLHDPNLVQMVPQMQVKRGGFIENVPLKFHECTSEDENLVRRSIKTRQMFRLKEEKYYCLD